MKKSKKKLVMFMAIVISALMLQGCVSESEKQVSDTERWIIASYAILTEINGWDYTYFPGTATSEINKEAQKESLEISWGVVDRESADESLEWVLEEGHRTGFAEDMQYLEEYGLSEIEEELRVSALSTDFGMTIDEAASYVNAYAIYESYGAEAIDAWDYCRALNLLSFYYCCAPLSLTFN